MENISIKNFKQVNFEIIDAEFYEIELNNDEVEIEVNFTPFSKSDDTIQIFLHIRYVSEIYQKEGDEGDLSLLHTDFLSEFQFGNKKLLTRRNKENLFDLTIFSDFLSKTISMARGFLICQTRGTSFNDIILPILSSKELLDESQYVKRKRIVLQKK